MDAELPPDLETAILDSLPVGVLVLEPTDSAPNPAFRCRVVNRVASALLAPSGRNEAVVDEAAGKHLLSLAPQLAQTDVVAALGRALRENRLQVLEQFIPAELSPSATASWYAVKVQPLGAYLLVIFEDISRQKAFEAHIKKLAFQDELTGVPNRRYFLARTPELLALAQREAWICALLYFDLNGFKLINDTYGHGVGDKVLRAVAWRLSEVSREGDIFFRSGGDEFALFLPNSGREAALSAARRIARELDAPFIIEGVTHRVGASIGVATMLSEEAHVDTLLERADAAMYDAKRRKGEALSSVRLWTQSK